MSEKVHSEHIVATKELMRGVRCLGWKVHSEHIGRFQAGGRQSRFELPSCLLIFSLTGKRRTICDSCEGIQYNEA